MRTKWNEDKNEYEVTSPLSGIIFAMAPVDDVSHSVTPELNIDEDSAILVVKLNQKNRLAGSIFSEVTKSKYIKTPDIDDVKLFKCLFNHIQKLIKDNKILAMHDISDGGLLTALAEMCFTKKVGMDIQLDDTDNINKTLFSEEIGFVIQVKRDDLDIVKSSLSEININVEEVANIAKESLSILSKEKEIFTESITVLEKYWRETSHAIQSIRDNKQIADSELNLLDNKNYHGLNSNISFNENQIKNLSIKGTKPKVAILREQGVNGQNEMAAVFTIAGFEAFDVHMQDLLDGNIDLKQFQGMAVCGGFSYGDVLGAGGGWSKTIFYNDNVKDQFQQFFENETTFTLGVCNGCQMLSNLKDIIPGADYWPSFERNYSDQFEARLVQVKVEDTDSVLLRNMNGWTVPVASAHGEEEQTFK